MKSVLKWAALGLAVVLPLSAQAHKAWILPSQTVLSKAGWITVDAAVSNDLFYFNHVPLRVEGLVVTGPDGAAVEAQNSHTGKYRTTFDLDLVKDGTYRIATVNSGLFAGWVDEKGERKRWRGTAETFAKEVPADAKELKVTQSSGRIETFVTLGKPNDVALKATGKGLELVPVTHPNDLFAGEAATFALHIDGKPAAGLEVEIVPGGSRYRDRQDEIKVTTDAQGRFSVTWPQPGMYWLEASLSDTNTSVPQAKERRASYVATLEVLPQ
ncbi:DUF4198 domain-containing protein [Dokdonella koreensis]|uniref:Nickel transport complex protein, NikM subunit, transmembrane n=1 Tax=Dokdonella koreensis DS-123 TaxID=1300342 RepID=A0A160DU05_9GAMM|nr:DUF4198 domain-containing protein [Dokdonella koreensis]ANB17889.1 Nickel transport complex protein, NikM subunit, transmembrane [Dokdonella koreensis DS-123]